MRYNIIEHGKVIARAATFELAKAVADFSPNYRIEDTETPEELSPPEDCPKCGSDAAPHRVRLAHNRERVSCPDCGYAEVNQPDEPGN